ncbi:threonine synthase [Clostridia bacterium OttesenSCG-928-F22]|nr:threonine synthase [Clostridia bacterium OttesenSCG-928-F22]
MKYVSTRGASSVSPSEAVLQGISPDGGLFVPQAFPNVTGEMEQWKSYTYEELSAKVLSLYFDDFSQQELLNITSKAYTPNFPKGIVPVRQIYGNTNMIELWHGPTLAFKDMALQVLPYLMGHAMDKTGEKRNMLILVATSGDTGKAALEGFSDVVRTSIAVFFPKDGVSAMQRLQMVTQEGANVHVCAVDGNFDDAQTGVKNIFADDAFLQDMEQRNIRLSSANSINWGRLSPQIAYYFHAYFRMQESGQVKAGEGINIVVPTGNFGNILAAYYAMRMGLPVKKLICASNDNSVLADFFKTGKYDAKRDFFKTISPSMDILISSNLERLLYEVSGRDAGKVKELMRSLREGQQYQIDGEMAQQLEQHFYGDWLSEEETRAEIRHVFEQHGYVMDPHTAVGHGVYRRYVEKTGDTTPTAIASTASPYKFPQDVLKALGKEECKDEQQACTVLSELSGLSIPEPLAALSGKPILHSAFCKKDGMREDILAWVGSAHTPIRE